MTLRGKALLRNRFRLINFYNLLSLRFYNLFNPSENNFSHCPQNRLFIPSTRIPPLPPLEVLLLQIRKEGGGGKQVEEDQMWRIRNSSKYLTSDLNKELNIYTTLSDNIQHSDLVEYIIIANFYPVKSIQFFNALQKDRKGCRIRLFVIYISPG